MSRNMNEYKKSMDNIVPSESFISETEALMKQALAQKRTADKISQNNNRKKITFRTTAAVSAAAAVFICIAAAGVYNSSRVGSDMVTEEVIINETVSETDIVSEVTTVSEADTIYVSEPVSETRAVSDTDPADISETETAAETEIVNVSETNAPVITEEISDETEAAAVVGHDEAPVVTSSAEEVVEEAVSVSFTAETVQTEQTTQPLQTESIVTEPEISVTEEEYDIAPHNSDENEYDDALVEAEEAYDEGASDSAGAPVYVPPFDDADYGYGSIDEEEAAEETEESAPMPITLSLKSYDPDMFSTVNEVYVPDYVTDLEIGSYNMTITAGYDEFDEETGAIISGGDVYLSNDMISQLERIIYTLDNVSGNSRSSHMDKESVLYNYRYKITVNSAIADEDNALLFEIAFDSNALIINRYDNGTVSSDRYDLSENDYMQIDTVLSSLF